MDEITINSRDRLPTPAGYIVPLRDEGQPARSYVFAFTHLIGPEEAEAHLPSASNFTGHDIPYRASEVIRFPLNAGGFNQLPANLFARGLLSSFDWANPKPGEFAAAFTEQHGGDGYVIPLSGFAVILREGQRPDNGIGLPAGEGALWRDGRATVCVDLDGMFRNDAVRTLHAVVSDLGIAGGVIGLERNILDGRALKWDSNLGRFLSPEETFESYQRERVEALDQLGDTIFRRAVHPARLSRLRPKVRERAEDQGRSFKEEWRAGRRRNLGMAVSSLLADEVATFTTHIVESPPRGLKEWVPEFDEFRTSLERKLRAALSRAMTEDYLDDPKWRSEHRQVELKEEYAASEPAEQDAAPRNAEAVLADRYGRLLLTRAKLTATEKRVLGAFLELQEGETLADWARRNGMSPATANVHKLNVKRKLEKAKKLT